jgi:hypothetical protein
VSAPAWQVKLGKAEARLLAAPADELALILRACVESPGEAAAVEVVLQYGAWLHDEEFRKRVVWLHPDTGACRLRMEAMAQMAAMPPGGKAWTIGALFSELGDDQTARDAVAVGMLGLAQGRWS